MTIMSGTFVSEVQATTNEESPRPFTTRTSLNVVAVDGTVQFLMESMLIGAAVPTHQTAVSITLSDDDLVRLMRHLIAIRRGRT